MKDTLLLLTLFLTTLLSFGQVQNATFTVVATDDGSEFFDADEEISITVSDIDPDLWGVDDIYLWAWYFDLDDNEAGNSPTNGEWTNSSESQKFANNGDGTFTYTLIPSEFYGTSDIGRIGMLAKAKDGTGDKKTQDNLVEVGVFQATLVSPESQTTIVEDGESLLISATASVDATFVLSENGSTIDTQTATTSYTYNAPISDTSNFELVITNDADVQSQTFSFTALTAPDSEEASVPDGMENGINFNPENPGEMTLVIFAPNKSFIHLIGNFPGGSWSIDNDFLLKKDSAKDAFWITIDGLDEEGQDVLFQYLVDGTVRVADPYSEQLLSEFNDPFIGTETFPGLPSYPAGETSELVTWVNTAEDEYEFQNTDFERPAQEELIIYELLIRDFDELHSFDAVKERLNYLENLGVNAIELMPVNEFDGNISWGYNPSFHMALDKYYGTRNAFKSFVDECHSRGIAVILDVVYNHGTGQAPYYRMYNDCDGCYNGTPTSDNPMFNQEDPNTAFQFFNDINHEAPFTQEWLDRMNRYWIEEYHIDGYRFDFTKGFTNNVGDGGAFDASRIALLERMYDELRAVDPTAYVILEHFAPDSEETELIQHRATTDDNEPGMLVWSNHVFNYNEGTMGYNEDNKSDFSRISYLNRGWDTPSSVGYMESHDEERLNYKNQAFGNSSGDYDVQELDTALDRLELAGAFYFTVPGPKMIWQFGELGYDFSINYCEDGSINDSCRVDPKPIPWNEGYDDNTDRTDIYDIWSRIIELRQFESIFQTDVFTIDATRADGVKIIQLEDTSAGDGDIQYVNIIGNFGVEPQAFDPEFQETGTWYDMLTYDSIEITDSTEAFSLEPGEFRIFSNEQTQLSLADVSGSTIQLFPNPSSNMISLSAPAQEVMIYDIAGKLLIKQDTYEAGELINVSALKTGLYIVTVTDGGAVSSLKLMKN